MAEKKNLTDVFKERKGKVETDAETGTSAMLMATTLGGTATISVYGADRNRKENTETAEPSRARLFSFLARKSRIRISIFRVAVKSPAVSV